MVKISFIAAALSAILASQTYAHDWLERSFKSEILGEERVILVSAPDNLDTLDHKLPLVIALDGDYHIDHLKLVSGIAYQSGYPNIVIVGLPNTNRERDLMYTATDEFPGGGGAASFLRFLSEELIPMIEAEYAVSDYRILFGHSAGGGFGAYAMMEQPDLFDAYILGTPNVFWNNFELADRLKPALESGALDDISIYFTLANETGVEAEGVRRFAALVKKYKDKKQWRFQYHPDESHTSLPLVTGHYGLKRVFSAFALPEHVRKAGLQAIVDYYADVGARFSYDTRAPQRVLLDYGYEQIAKGDAAAGEAVFRQYLEDYPDNPLASFALGEALESQGKYVEAADIFDDLIWMDPTLEGRAADLRARAAQNG